MQARLLVLGLLFIQKRCQFSVTADGISHTINVINKVPSNNNDDKSINLALSGGDNSTSRRKHFWKQASSENAMFSLDRFNITNATNSVVQSGHGVEQVAETGDFRNTSYANKGVKSTSANKAALNSSTFHHLPRQDGKSNDHLEKNGENFSSGNIAAFATSFSDKNHANVSIFSLDSISLNNISVFGDHRSIYTSTNATGPEQISSPKTRLGSGAASSGASDQEAILESPSSITARLTPAIVAAGGGGGSGDDDDGGGGGGGVGNDSNLGRKGQRPSHESVSLLLDTLMLGYDKSLRPGFGGEPLIVKADMEIRSMGPISEKDMIYSMDCYFRQKWTDRRLSFNASREKVTNVSLNVIMLERIWRPDTIFINGGQSYVHTITTPNKFFRLSHDGTIFYSQRLTVKASCPMHLEKFPMDTQQCPLHITSFGYSISDVVYEWHYGNQLAAVAANDMRLSQFDLQGMPACNVTRAFKGTQHSVLTVFFDFRRHTGYFLIQVYLPCCLLVVLSWVSFWINREATADRISLGSLTMLTMTFLVLDTRNDLPRVAYSTALDVYVFMCFCFIFASIIQFAAVHFYTKYGTADAEIPLLAETDDEDNDNDSAFDPGDASDDYHTQPEAESLVGCLRKMWRCLLSTRSKRFTKNVRNALGLNSVSKIDKVARVLFPAAFCGLNMIYWMSYWC